MKKIILSLVVLASSSFAMARDREAVREAIQRTEVERKAADREFRAGITDRVDTEREVRTADRNGGDLRQMLREQSRRERF